MTLDPLVSGPTMRSAEIRLWIQRQSDRRHKSERISAGKWISRSGHAGKRNPHVPRQRDGVEHGVQAHVRCSSGQPDVYDTRGLVI